jgi:large subunit ribosomal protein L25
MADLTLAARRRTVLGKKVGRLRRAGVTPCNIYGRNVESVAIEADTHDLALLLRRAGRTHLIDLRIEGERSPRPVLVRQLTRKPTNDLLLHVDFFQVSMREKLTVAVPVVLTGHAPAVEEYDAVVVQSLDTVQVECLPGDIPTQIEADISGLVDMTTSLFVRDLVTPTGVEILTDPDQAVASVTGESREEEEPVVEEEAAAEEPISEAATAEEAEERVEAASEEISS